MNSFAFIIWDIPFVVVKCITIPPLICREYCSTLSSTLLSPWVKDTWGYFHFPLLMLGSRLLWHSKMSSCMFSGHLKRPSKTVSLPKCHFLSSFCFFYLNLLFVRLFHRIYLRRTNLIKKKSQITACEYRTPEDIQLVVMFLKSGIRLRQRTKLSDEYLLHSG